MRKASQITLRDLAARLNVSKVTVSKALRDHPDIAPATKARIKRLAEKLDYTPNTAARTLSSRSSNTIGVVMPKVAHSFSSSVIESIYEAAFTHHYEIILTISMESAERESRHIKTLLSMRVEGLLVAVSQETKSAAIFELVKKKGVPLVFFDRVIASLGCSTVTVDDRRGACGIVTHAIGVGYRRFAHFAGYAHTSIGRERRAGFVEALQAHGLPVREEWILEGGFSEEYGYRSMQALCHAGNLPQVIFAVTFPVALGIYQAARELGLKIPSDIDVICFGDSNTNRFLSPALTCVDQPTRLIGKQAVELLLEEIASPTSPAPRQIVVPTKLRVRETCITKAN